MKVARLGPRSRQRVVVTVSDKLKRDTNTCRALGVRLTDPAIIESWESEYRRGRYLDDPPVPFVNGILEAARARGLGSADGLYIGCGNGRNYLPLVLGGLDLLGLDISATALAQLARRAPDRAVRLVLGDLSALPLGARYPIVIAIQVLQHGNEETTHLEVLRAIDRVAPGGLFCVRVNAVGTEPWYAHELTERGEDGRFTVRYTAGPKRGLAIHFFSAEELRVLVEDGLVPDLPLRPAIRQRAPPESGQEVQWEGIWMRPRRPARSVLA
jgi:hypothetical protein